MSHDAHEAVPGYSPAQVLADGCGECRYRSEHPDVAVAHMDPQSFATAWKRAAAWQRDGLGDVSAAEVPVLRVLWALAVQFERLGFPIGDVPADPARALVAAAGVVPS